MNTSKHSRPLVVGVLLGALLGAITLQVLLRLPEIFLRVALEPATGLQASAGILISAFQNAFGSAWSAVGALTGGLIAWRRLRVQSGIGNHADDAVTNRMPRCPDREGKRPRTKLHPGEALAGCGIVSLAIAIALIHFVMGIIFASAPAPLAVLLLAAGVIRARNPSVSGNRQVAGFILLFLALTAMAVVMFNGASFSYKLAILAIRPGYAAQHLGAAPGLWEWAGFLGTGLVPVLLTGPGLWLWTDWSPARRKGWCVAVFLSPVAALLAHQIFVAIGFPLTA